MKHSFLDRPSPVITSIMGGQTPEELIAQARNSEFSGAQGIAIDLADLKPEFRNHDSLKRVIDSVELPFMFFFYRADRWEGLDDENRQKVLLTAAGAGAAMIDVMGDLYDPSPMEITRDPEAIRKQVKLIDEIHAAGAQVVISSHMQVSRTCQEVFEHLEEVAKRGADVVKIVTMADTEEELAEAFRTTMFLKRELKTPFIHLCNGKFSRPHRFMGPALGTSILFAVERYEPKYGLSQPTVAAVKAVLDNLHWNIKDYL